MSTTALVEGDKRIPARNRPAYLPAGWPVLGILFGMPVLWLLGLHNTAWLLAAVPMALNLWERGSVRAPRGMGLWLIFLAFSALSITQVGSASKTLVWGFRWGLYLAAGIALVYAFNQSRTALPTSRILNALAAYWLIIIAGGVAGLVFGDVKVTSLAQNVLPRGLAQEQFIADLIRPTVAQVHAFLGYEVARPAAPFAFTNGWGSNVALWTPFFVLWAGHGGRRRRVFAAIAIAVALIPIVQSLNRGLWLSLGAGMVYVAMRYAVRGKARPLFMLIASASALAVLLVVSPLGSLFEDRLETGHSDSHRLSIYTMSIEATMRSPIVGHGGTVANPEQPGRSPAGTHGQLWAILVPYGVPAAIAFVAFLGVLVWRTRTAAIGTFDFWTHAVLFIACVQLPFYSLTPTQLPLLMVVAGIALRDVADHAEFSRSRPLPSGHGG